VSKPKRFHPKTVSDVNGVLVSHGVPTRRVAKTGGCSLQEAPLQVGEVSVLGMILTASPASRPLSEVFPRGSKEWKDRIEAQARRVKKGLKRELLMPKPKHLPQAKKNYDFGGVSKLDLRMCNCSFCGKLLLGEKDEELRRRCVARKLACAKRFPPPVAGRVLDDRPCCADCLPEAKGKVAS
jgi:hypothetical protein